VSGWAADNAVHNARVLARVRLLLRRRALWMRHRWNDDDLRAFSASVVSDRALDVLLASDDAAETSFFADEPAARALDAALDALAAEEARHANDVAERWGRAPALAMLSAAFELDPFARDAIALAFAAAEDERLVRACAYLNDDLQLAFPTVSLAPAVLVRDPAARPRARAQLERRGVLRRYALLAWPHPAEHWSAAHPLALDERMIDYLHGGNRFDARIADVLRPARAPLVAASHAPAIDAVETILRDGRGWPRIALTGASRAGGEDVAGTACERVGLRLFELDAGALAARPSAERAAALALLGRDAALTGAAYFVDPNDDEPLAEASAAELASALEAPLLVRSPRALDRPFAAVRLPPLGRAAQRELWDGALARAGQRLNGEVDRLAQQFDFGPRAIARSVESALARERPGGRDAALSGGELWSACREVGAVELGPFMASIMPVYGWDDIVLPAHVLALLRDVATQVAQRARVYETWAFGRTLSRGGGITALFTGESGTGKTMAAEVLARELELDLYRVDLSGVVSKYIGETEKHLRRVFDAAERSGALLFFDEADALFGKRSEVRDSHDRYANIEVNYLLQRMEEYRGLAILATNRKDALDPAFMRRLRFVVEFPFPDQEHRRRMWELVFPAAAAREELDVTALARLEVAGGHIRTIALNAAFLAAGEDRAIGMTHVMRAAAREYRKLERGVGAGEFGDYAQAVRR
jgi:hypothetical protein